MARVGGAIRPPDRTSASAAACVALRGSRCRRGAHGLSGQARGLRLQTLTNGELRLQKLTIPEPPRRPCRKNAPSTEAFCWLLENCLHRSARRGRAALLAFQSQPLVCKVKSTRPPRRWGRVPHGGRPIAAGRAVHAAAVRASM